MKQTTAVEFDKESESIFTKGVLVIAQNGRIVRVSDELATSGINFCGMEEVSPKGGGSDKRGYYSKFWDRDSFQLFKGTITITQK